MQTKINSKDLVSDKMYWYIYQGGGKCQLLMVSVEEDGYLGTFDVMLSEDDTIYKSFPIKIDTDEEGYIENLFEFDDKESAEIIWVHYFLKDFKDNTFVDIEHFFELVEKYKNNYPELVIKGL